MWCITYGLLLELFSPRTRGGYIILFVVHHRDNSKRNNLYQRHFFGDFERTLTAGYNIVDLRPNENNDFKSLKLVVVGAREYSDYGDSYYRITEERVLFLRQ